MDIFGPYPCYASELFLCYQWGGNHHEHLCGQHCLGSKYTIRPRACTTCLLDGIMVGSNVSLETPGKAMLGVLGRNHVFELVLQNGSSDGCNPRTVFLGPRGRKEIKSHLYIASSRYFGNDIAPASMRLLQNTKKHSVQIRWCWWPASPFASQQNFAVKRQVTVTKVYSLIIQARWEGNLPILLVAEIGIEWVQATRIWHVCDNLSPKAPTC